MIRVTSALALLIVAGLTLAGCSAPVSDAPSPSTSASETAEPAGPPPLASLADIAGTRWLAEDSQGDTTTIKFDDDGGVSYSSSGQQFDYDEDTWTVSGDTITWQVSYGARFGIWTCVGTFDPATQLISGTWTSTVGESGTLELHQPIR